MKRRAILFAVLVAVLVAVCAVFYVAGKRISRVPSIKLNGSSQVKVVKGSSFDDDGATAMLGRDNISGKIKKTTNLNTNKIGKYTVTYSVTRFRKTYSVKRTVRVVDEEKPVIKLTDGSKITWRTGKTFKDPGYTAEDDTDGDITSKVKTGGYVDVYTPGTYQLTYSVTDASGNATVVKRTVVVKGKAVKGESIIYLTFDDGPSSKVTPKILRVLKRNNVKATFFVINYDETGKKLLQQEIREGHTIGIHSYSHDYAKIYSSVNAYMQDYYKLKNKVKKDTGYEPFVMRFPGGSSNTVSRHYSKHIMTKLTKRMNQEGIMYEDWNVDSTDASGNGIASSVIVKNVTHELQKGRSNVVLCHDTNAKETTAKALQRIIDYGKKHGYTFKAISRDSYQAHQRVLN